MPMSHPWPLDVSGRPTGSAIRGAATLAQTFVFLRPSQRLMKSDLSARHRRARAGVRNMFGHFLRPDLRSPLI